MPEKKKILFVCTHNVSRSRTAEDLFINSQEYEVKSAGLLFHQDGKQVVAQELINWADVVIAMNETEWSNGRPPCRHSSKLKEKFDLKEKKIVILGIPDVYGRGNSHLIWLLRSKLKEIAGINI
ncbi:MAG: hypothetical protein A3B86_00430 [Candidatus Yanofskybacteria bacterium RIFCSPHIGHO2_02_FULL_38_22b]|uniref:Phosphotyrosine protein phosphatase I domain-containing protein n=1 Tax=Candidatus Yanofskybacteria bacterium RIFCSPHIGHO2_02_FULL_38_22b TaxID=1802673 RepID=A0A1F8F322_9BACT|nr:MAG: hypothetical protein A2816_02905 [Candidatus Yanofskybacteria bacterium RIFCSPHIGHO2_01_FULL_39_44]OGN06646.1 MAG: hypothetical protein A3B86_00430 [Candidatus Yanofskybacteria bacterium RIFCSPHIGHO2_02_FULL_38_22b]OGN20576.1 MAG: hypothetical protein A2910_01815 [Candidatus Yanofskybacteria bacterium RIFCSPLOWO2_01_FULL_39_28]